MKRTTLFNLFILGFVLIFAATGCKKVPKGTTTIPKTRPDIGSGKPDTEVGTGGKAQLIDPANPDGTHNLPDRGSLDGRPQNREMFAGDTVYFDVDSATVKSSEKSKLDAVATGFKSQTAGDLLVEGHCDDRGTEGYNLSLGDRRANALREYLVNLGVSADKIHTVSFGEAQPAVTGTGDAVWSKNRRGVFIFVEPAK